MSNTADQRILGAAAAVFFVLLWLSGGAALGAGPLSRDQAVTLLKPGGHVIFFRHAMTDHSRQDTDPFNTRNCAAQRPLSAEGLAQADAIGRAFKTLGLPVGDVLSSEFCRCEQTARRAFGDAALSRDLSSFSAVPPIEKQRRVLALKRLLGMTAKPGTNTVIVGHKFMFQNASGILLEEGEGAVFTPLANGAFRFEGRINPAAWELPTP